MSGYLLWYSFGRFFIEGMRTDSLWMFGIIRISQLVSIVLFLLGIAIIVVRRRRVQPCQIMYRLTIHNLQYCLEKRKGEQL